MDILNKIKQAVQGMHMDFNQKPMQSSIGQSRPNIPVQTYQAPQQQAPRIQLNNSIGQSRPNIPQQRVPINLGNVANQVWNTKAPIGIQPTLNPFGPQKLNMASPHDLYNMAAPVWQQPLKAAGGLLLQTQNPQQRVNLNAGMKTPVGSAISKIAFGQDTPLNTFSQTLNQGINIPLVNKHVGGLAGAGLAGIGTGIALTGLTTGGEKAAGKDLVEQLAKNSATEKEFLATMRNTPAALKEAIKMIKSTKNNYNTLEDIFQGVNFGSNLSKANQVAKNEKYIQDLKDQAKLKLQFPEGVDVAKPQGKPTFKINDVLQNLREQGRNVVNAVSDQTGSARLDLGLTGGGEKLSSKVRQGESSPNIIPQDVKAGISDVTGKVAQTEAQVAKSLSPAERTAQQVQESRQSALEASNGSGNISGGGQKPPSLPSVPESSPPNYNINTNRLKMNVGQKKTFSQVVEAIKPQLEEAKGAPLSNAEIKKAAKSSEMLSKVTSREQTAQAEASILRARQRMVELNNNIDRLAKEGKTEEMRTQLRDLIETTKVISANAADAGRRLQSLSIDATDESLRTAMLKDISKTNASTEDILKAAESVNWNDARSITKFYRQFVKPSYSEILDEYRYNNMLSNPLTHLRNAYSNTLQTLVVRPATLVVEGRPVEAAKYLNGAVKSFPDAINAFRESFSGKTAMAKPDMAHIGTGKLPNFLTIPTRAMEAGDRFFTSLIQGGEMARGATAEQAASTAEYSLFRQGLNPKGQGPLLNSIDSLTNWTYKAPKAVRWFVPFIRTPMNFAKQWIEYSPAGFATAYGAGAPREQIAKAALGSTVTAFGAMLAFQGKTTWAAPTDPKQKDAFYAAGRKPFSILIGDKWVPMQYAGPFALALALPAAMKYYQEDNRTAPTDSQLDKATKTVASMAQFFSQQTFLTGLGNFVNWASGSQDVSLGSSLGFTAQQLVPMEGLISYVNTIIDPVYRKGNSFTESIQKNVPILSKQLPAYTNPDGTESTRLPINYALPYGVGQRNQQYEPQLQARTEKLQQNAINNKAKKEGTASTGTDDTAVKDRVRSTGKTETSGTTVYYRENGSVKSVQTKRPMVAPKYTGEPVIDKKLYSSFSSKITARQTEVVKLFELGKISKDQAVYEVKRLEALRKSSKAASGSGTGSSKKGKTPNLKAPNVKLKGVSLPNIKSQQAPKIKAANLNIPLKVSVPSAPSFKAKVKFNTSVRGKSGGKISKKGLRSR